MSFPKITPRLPRKPNRLQLVLTVTEDDSGARSYEASYAFVVTTNEDDPGERTEIERRQGDAIPHLTTTQRNQARGILDAALDLAKATVD